MGFFSTILQKLGLKKKDEPATPAAGPAKPAAPAVKPTTTVTAAKPNPFMGAGKDDLLAKNERKTIEPSKPTAVPEVDVVKHLEELSKGKNLNWKVSIVDLLKLLDIDSSREARNALAKELNCPANLMSDSAKMNVWLHKEVLRKIAENGGNIPQALLD